MACCQKSDDERAPVHRKQCGKLAKKIQNREVKEDHIMDKLDELIALEDRENAERFETIQVYSFEAYRYKEKNRNTEKSEKAELSLLHLAVSCDRDKVANILNDKAPNLSKAERTGDEFKGQTPFHIAVAKGKHRLVERMMSMDLKDNAEELLSRKARGSALKGTIMTGETPLSIAVLNCDEKMIDILLDKGADIMQGDSAGNTVMHTIVMYAYYFPEKTINTENPHFKKATNCLYEATKTNEKRLRTLMHVRNDKGLSPLQLACKKGLDEVFQYFLNLVRIYKFNLDVWGVEDTFCYDITEIDTVHWREEIGKEKAVEYDNAKLRPKNTEEVDEDFDKCCTTCTKNRKVNKRQSALQAISHLPFRDGLMVLLTVATIRKTDLFNLTNEMDPFDQNNSVVGKQQDILYILWNIFCLIMGYCYIHQEVVRYIYYRQPFLIGSRVPHNTICRFVFVLFGLSLICDSGWNFGEPNNYITYFALFFGWFGMLFFLRAIKFCSYHAVVFLEIITGDILRFCPVIFVTLIPLTAAAYEAFGNRKGNGFSNYSEALLTLFQWMNGLGEIDQVEKEIKPGLSITVFILFIIFGQIILLQTLIALMSTNLIKKINRLFLRRVQVLAIISFFESLLPTHLMQGLGDAVVFNNSKGEKKTQFHLQIHRADDDDIKEMDSYKTILENLINTVNRRNSLDTPIHTDRSRIATIQID